MLETYCVKLILSSRGNNKTTAEPLLISTKTFSRSRDRIESRHRAQNVVEQVLGPGLDLEFETDIPPSAPEAALYETAYVTSHKGQCRAGAFSPDRKNSGSFKRSTHIKLDVESQGKSETWIHLWMKTPSSVIRRVKGDED